MQYPKVEITEEKYNELSQLTRGELMMEVYKTIPVHWECGYGWYGCRLIREDGKYYIQHTIGSSCD